MQSTPITNHLVQTKLAVLEHIALKTTIKHKELIHACLNKIVQGESQKVFLVHIKIEFNSTRRKISSHI